VFNNGGRLEVRTLCIRIWRSRWTPVAGAVVLASIVPIGLASAAPGPRHSGHHIGDQPGFGGHGQWVSTWAASPQTAIPGTTDATGFNNQTIRNVVFSSVSGNVVRVRFTNTFGTQSNQPDPMLQIKRLRSLWPEPARRPPGRTSP
jgi:hypothetical protein